MCLFRKRRKQDRIAREIASRYNMLDDYLAARRDGCSPIEALEDWDLLQPEDRHLLEIPQGEIKKRTERGGE